MQQRNSLRTALLAAALLSAAASAQSTIRASTSTAGVEGNQFSENPSISADGRFVAFTSVAWNLVANDTNNADDAFVHDRISGATTRVSVATGGAQVTGGSAMPKLSSDGRFVVFEGWASDFVPGDTNGVSDIIVHDRQTTTTTRVSVSSAGAQANGASYLPSISADGRYIAFHSAASNLVAGDTNNAWDVFVHDRQTATTLRASVSNAGAQVTGICSNAAISANGRYVAFNSGSGLLVTGDTNASWDIFVRDLTANTTTRVSLANGGVQANGSSVSPSISADGRYVAFHSSATNLVPSDLNLHEDVFVHDRQTATTVRASVRPGGFDANDTSKYACISGDGRFVAFESIADDLVAGDLNGDSDVFVYDLATGATQRASVDSAGDETSEASKVASISYDGRFVSFESYGSTLVPGDTNNTGDVFVRDQGTSAPRYYCTAGTTSHGCVAAITATGTPSASASSGFTLTVTNVEGLKQGLLFYGIDNTGFTPSPWGQSTSFLCVRPPTQRTVVQSSGGLLNACNGTLTLDWNAFIAANPAALGNPMPVGQHVFAQGWFRDPPSPKTTMLSNAVEFTVGL